MWKYTWTHDFRRNVFAKFIYADNLKMTMELRAKECFTFRRWLNLDDSILYVLSCVCTAVGKVSQKYFMIRVLCLSASLRLQVLEYGSVYVFVCVWILPMNSIKLKDQTELFFAWAERNECTSMLWVYVSRSMFNAMDCLFKVELANCENPQIKEIRYSALCTPLQRKLNGKRKLINLILFKHTPNSCFYWTHFLPPCHGHAIPSDSLSISYHSRNSGIISHPKTFFSSIGLWSCE